MPALDTVGDYLAEARRLLQDQFTPYRYPDEDLVEALNIALTEVRRLRADLLLPSFVIPYFDSSGTIDMTALVPFEPMYRSALTYYVVGRAQLRDDEATTDTRASALLAKFTSQMLVIQS
jgi:hypothetical protein